MITKKLLGISLALVMLIGSVPLGFSEPLRVQLEQGIETNQIQCDNPNHVLVLRTNGNVACVTEKTSEKLGWETFEDALDINKILDEFPVEWSDETLNTEYDFPLTAKQPEITSSQNGEPLETSYTKAELQISNLPKLLESAEISVIVTDIWDSNEPLVGSIEDMLTINISNNFEVMSGLEDFSVLHYEDVEMTGYQKWVTVEEDQTPTF